MLLPCHTRGSLPALCRPVAVLPVDVNESDWDCTLAPPAPPGGGDIKPKWDWGRAGPSVRLGFRMVRGLSERVAERVVKLRQQCGGFRSMDHFCKATALSPSVLCRLANADAF